MKWVKTISSFESVKCLFDTAAGKVWKCQKEFQSGNEIFNLRWKFFISYQPKKETISSRLLRSKGLGEGSRINNLSRHSWQSLTNFETETMTIMKVTWQTESDTWTVFAITCNVLWFVWQYLILTIKDSLTNPKDLLNFCQIVLPLTFEFCRSGSPQH